MENNIEQRVQDKIAKGITYNFDTFMADGWRIFKKTALPIAGVSFLLAIPVIIIYAILAPFLFGIESFEQYMNIAKHDPFFMQRMMRSPVFLFKQIALGIVLAVAFAPINAGLLKMCREADKTGEVNFGSAFAYYKAPYFGKLIVVTLLMTVISNLSQFVFGFIPILGPLLNLAVTLGMYVFIAYVQPLIIFGNADLGKAFSLSFALSSKKFAAVLGFSLLFVLLFMLGLIACCIGILFTIAFIPTCNYLLYKHAVGFPEDDEDAAVQPGNWQQDQPPTT